MRQTLLAIVGTLTFFGAALALTGFLYMWTSFAFDVHGLLGLLISPIAAAGYVLVIFIFFWIRESIR